MTEKPQSLNLELLIKLLKLTASSNDAEALLAMRKATEVLLKFGGDWEALLHSKVTVIADPFTVAAPPPRNEREFAPPPPPRAQAPRPQPPPKAAAQTPQYTHPSFKVKRRFGGQAAAPAAAQTPSPAPTRNTLRKQRVQLDDLA